MRLLLTAILVIAGTSVSAAGHYCDDVPEADRAECLRDRVRGDDDCTRIGDDAERLVCWDRQRAVEDCASRYLRLDGQSEEECVAEAVEFFALPEERVAEEAVAEESVADETLPAEPTRWRIEESVSLLDDSPTVVVSTDSENWVPDRFGGQVGPANLIMRCMENRTNVFFRLNGAFLADSGGFGNVTLRIDDGSPINIGMSASTNNEALGIWEGNIAIGFIRPMLGAERLLIRITPFNESPVDLAFPLAGIEEAIAPLREACGW